MVDIQKIQKSFSFQIATLHIQGIPTGFISSLGQGFVTALYQAISEDENSFGFVAVEDDKVLGFVAFSSNLGKLYKHVALKKAIRFGFVLARKMISLRVIKKVIGNIFYPHKMRKMDLPDAELLSIVIAPQGRSKGLASKLVKAGLEECRKRGISKVKVLVASGNELANKLYQKSGFDFLMEIDSHGIQSSIYVAEIK